MTDIGGGFKIWVRDNTAFRVAWDHQEISQTLDTSFGSFDVDTSQDLLTLGFSVLFD